MYTAIIILSAAVVILGSMLIMRVYEEHSIVRQMKRLFKADTNELIHTSGTSRALIRSINIMLKELRRNEVVYKRKSHDMEQMLTNISHDLRTPLTSALGYIDLLQDPGLSDEERERELGIVELRLRRLEELINAFFEFSSVISGGHEPELSELNIVGAVEEAIAHYYDDYSSRGRMIEFDCSDRHIKVNSNRNMLMRIFDNLISNAFKHGTGTLYISAAQGERTVLTFRNQIIDDELDVSRVFDEFYTTDISRTRGNTGLGLAIAKQFTELLGGEITASREGEWFTVKVTM